LHKIHGRGYKLVTNFVKPYKKIRVFINKYEFYIRRTVYHI